MAEAKGNSAADNHDLDEEHILPRQPAGAVEMTDFKSSQPAAANSDTDTPDTRAGDTDNSATVLPTEEPDTTTAPPSSKAQGKAPVTAAAVAPEQDALEIESAGPQGDNSTSGNLACDIMLLLPTGERHPFRIDEKYLAKRNVTVTGKTQDGKLDPFSITVYTLKELILRDWRKEWDAPPREPTSIRLIHFGRMLEDKTALNQYQFSNEVRNVVHMTVKPQEIIDEEEAAKKVKDSGRESGDRGCSSCCVIL